MAELLDLVLAAPAFWGAAGAFIYAGPRWLACAYPAKGLAWRCTLEAAIAIAVGLVAAAAFARWTLHLLHQAPGDLPAVAAMVGLLANRLAPMLVDGLSTAAANALLARTQKLLSAQPPRSGDPPQ